LSLIINNQRYHRLGRGGLRDFLQSLASHARVARVNRDVTQTDDADQTLISIQNRQSPDLSNFHQSYRIFLRPDLPNNTRYLST
jgi:hypothetical protein